MPSNHLTSEERAEGERLLALSREVSADCMGDIDLAKQWLHRHADALLADREAVAREAVREFAEAMASQFLAFRQMVKAERDGSLAHDYYNGIHRGMSLCEEALDKLAARGVTLESEREA